MENAKLGSINTRIFFDRQCVYGSYMFTYIFASSSGI